MEEYGLLSYVKKVIHSLVVSTPMRMTLEKLKRDYLQEEGCAVPFHKLGYRDIESFLHNIPDTVMVSGHGPMAYVSASMHAKTAHIQNLVQCQKKPNSKNHKKHRPRFNYSSERSNFVFVTEQRTTNYRRFNNNNHNSQNNNHYGNRKNQKSSYARYHSNSSNNYNSQYSNRRNENRDPVTSQRNLASETNSMTRSFANFKIAHVDEESSSDESNNYEIYVSDKEMFTKSKEEQIMPALTEKQSVANNNMQKSFLEYVSSDEGCDEDAIPAYAVDERILNYKYKSSMLPRVEKPTYVEPCYDEPRNEKLKEEDPMHEKLKHETSNEILKVEEPRHEIEKPTYVEPCYDEPRNEKLKEEHPMHEKPKQEPSNEILKIEEPRHFIIRHEDPDFEYVSSDEGSDSDAIPTYAVDERVLSVDYPKDAVRFDQALPARDIHKKFKLDERLKVQLVTVASPHSFNFWIHDEEYEDYKAMFTNMQHFYNSIDELKYTIPLFLIMAGHLGAIHFMGALWQRVQVLDMKTDNRKNIEVELVDTGNRIWVCHSDLKYLHKDFVTLPAQRWSGRLACVTPRQGQSFSAVASYYFNDLVSYRILYAKIEKIDESNNTLYMVLVDPEALTITKNINMALVESGHVRRCYSP